MDGMLNYYIPDDGDSPDHMNICLLPTVDFLCLKHIKKAFPLPGTFHFRFKQAFEGTYVWLDVVHDEDRVPEYNGLVVCKIARILKPLSVDTSERSIEKEVPPTVMPQKQVEDLIKTFPDSPKTQALPSENSKLNDDIASLLSDPISNSPKPIPRTPQAHPSPMAKPTVQHDPFYLFNGTQESPLQSHTQQVKPSTSGGVNQNYQQTPYIHSPISQQQNRNLGNMGMNMGNMQQQQANNGMQQSNNGMRQPQRSVNSNFMDLQWQGMQAPTSQSPQQQAQRNNGNLQQQQQQQQQGLKKW